MTIEELKEWQDRSLTEFQSRAESSDPQVREGAIREARDRLFSAGIIDENDCLAFAYR